VADWILCSSFYLTLNTKARNKKMKNSSYDLYRLVRLVLSPLMNQRGQAGSSDGTDDQTITVKVGDEEKTFTPEDVTNLLAQQAEATKKSQQVTPLLDMAARYGVSVEDLATNAEGTFGLMSKLIDEGIINDKGEIITKTPGTPPDPMVPPVVPGTPAPGGTKQLEVAMKALIDPLATKLESIEESNIRLRSDNANLMRLRISDKLESKFPEFSSSDIATVFSMAEKDPNVSLLDHANKLNEDKKAGIAAQEAEFVKKYGIDIEKAKEAHAFEQDPQGAAAAVVSGKKISFKRGDDAVTPAQASQKFFSKFDGFKA